jgi:hypothetical protein
MQEKIWEFYSRYNNLCLPKKTGPVSRVKTFCLIYEACNKPQGLSIPFQPRIAYSSEAPV